MWDTGRQLLRICILPPFLFIFTFLLCEFVWLFKGTLQHFLDVPRNPRHSVVETPLNTWAKYECAACTSEFAVWFQVYGWKSLALLFQQMTSQAAPTKSFNLFCCSENTRFLYLLRSKRTNKALSRALPRLWNHKFSTSSDGVNVTCYVMCWKKKMSRLFLDVFDTRSSGACSALIYGSRVHRSPHDWCTPL